MTTKSFNILHVARAPRTGVWSVMRQLAHWQLSMGHRVGFGLLIPRNWPNSYEEQLEIAALSGIKIFRAPSPDVFGTGAMLYHQLNNPISDWAHQFHRPGDTTILHFHNAWLSGAYLPVKSSDVSTVATFHGIQGERSLRQQPVRRCLHTYWAKRLERFNVTLASVDRQGVDTASSLFGMRSELFTVIPNGTAVPAKVAQGSPRLNNLRLPITVGHVGLLDQGKGWRITGEAVQSMHEAGIPIRLLIAGSGPESSDAEHWSSSRSEFVDFLGHKSEPLRDVFPRLDVLSLPSLSEGLPMAVLEAMSMGVVPVTTAVGGLPDLIQSGENGILIERGVTGVRNALERLYALPDLHRHCSLGAITTHRSKFSAEVMGFAYDKLYRKDQIEESNT
jgi:glycosyltransferase involved in cell wall biosynthesis